MEQEAIIKSIIENIFNHTACTISKLEISLDGGMLWCMIETPDSRFMIGREGETLRSLNHIVRKMAEKASGQEEISNIFVDVNGYQKKRFDNLKNIAVNIIITAKSITASALEVPNFENLKASL